VGKLRETFPGHRQQKGARKRTQPVQNKDRDASWGDPARYPQGGVACESAKFVAPRVETR